MNELTKQLREAIKKWNSGVLVEGESAKIICLIFNQLPTLLDEHERLERESEKLKKRIEEEFTFIYKCSQCNPVEYEKLKRESEAGKVLAQRIVDIAPTTDARGSLDFTVYQYRSACEGEK